MVKTWAVPTKTTMKPAKLKAIVHHVIATTDPARLGSVRLNKILWYADTISYRTDGHPITGETYVKRPRGPVAKHMLKVLGDLEHDNAIAIRRQSKFGKEMNAYMALTEANTGALTPDELALVDEVRDVICNAHTADSISALSHDQVWEAANLGEIIPLSASLVADAGEPTDEMLKWAASVVARYEAQKAA